MTVSGKRPRTLVERSGRFGDVHGTLMVRPFKRSGTVNAFNAEHQEAFESESSSPLKRIMENFHVQASKMKESL